MATKKIYSILLVEDEADQSDFYKFILEKAGYRVQTASNYGDAIRLVEEKFDIAIIDIELDKADPLNADGLRVVAQLNKRESRPQIILATAFRDRMNKAWEELVYDVWEKGESQEKLLEQIRTALEQREKLTPTKIKTSLTAIISKMSREKLNLEAVLTLILNEMTALIDADAANISLVNNNKIIVKATTAGQQKVDEEFDVERSVTGWAVQRQKTVYIPDIENNPQAYNRFQPALGEDKRRGSEFAVPILINLEPVAVINFESPKKHAFKETDIKLIEELANQLAIAINSARLQDQTNTVRELSYISSEINAVTHKGESVVAGIALDKLCEFLKSDKAAIFNLSSNGDHLELIAQRGLSEEYILDSIDLRPHGDSPRTLAIDLEIPLIVSDIENDRRLTNVVSLAKKEGFRALLELPLKIHERVVGSIVAYYKDVHYFEDEELSLANMFADHVAIAVTNAQQYEKLEELKNFEKKQAEERLAAEIVHRMKNSIGAIRVWVMNAERDCSTIIEQNSNLKEAFIHIKSNAEEALELVRELKSKQGILQAKDVNVEKHIKLALEVTNINQSIYNIKMHFEDKPVVVLADDHLNRVFANLIENALEAMPRGGTLEIGCKIVDDYAEAWISDTGQGIPKKHIDDIFSFWYSNKEGEGHGTGLWWVKNYVEAFRGNVFSESQGVNKGAKFTLRLPLASTRKVFTMIESLLED